MDITQGSKSGKDRSHMGNHSQLENDDKVKALNHDLKELELKKRKLKKKLDELKNQSDTQDVEIKVLKKQYNEELEDLNDINYKITKQEADLKKHQEKRSKNEAKRKQLINQIKGNNDNMTLEQRMKMQHAGDEDEDGDNILNMFKSADTKYQVDHTVLKNLNNVIEFKLGEALDDVRGNAQILGRMQRPVNKLQAICVKYVKRRG